MFDKVLIANRGAIACRVIRTLRKMGVASVAVYSEADRHSLHVRQADEAVLLGPPPAQQSYLSTTAILRAARKTGAQAIHPGYGFLSENADFAQACAEQGIVFIGPTPMQMRVFGLKHTARQIASESDVPLLPGTGLLPGVIEAEREAARIGYPIMLKSTAGGGGIGMRLCRSPEELRESYAAVDRLSRANFGHAGLYIEKFVTNASHIEVQIFGDGAGAVLALGERDCSAQRRHQKVMEESPAPLLPKLTREKLLAAAVRLGKAVRYQSAGTVEYIYNGATQAFYFLEVNTRLQVEHGVTEEVTGIDLVEWMIRQAARELVLPGSVEVAGSSLQVRVYAEDPAKNFQPSSGRITHLQWPQPETNARVETWVEPGTDITPFYDPLLAKIIVHGANRADALRKMDVALRECEIAGIETNLAYLRQLVADPQFCAGGISTAFLNAFDYRRSTIEVIESGTQTTVQDYPGRLGYWHVGVPPSGPMDSLAFRIANRLVGNPESAAALEIAVTGPSLRFSCDVTIAVTGADFAATLDGASVGLWQAIFVSAGSVLEMTGAPSSGTRAYLAVAGGVDVPEYLASRSTFILGKFGGHAGRALRAGDVLHLVNPTQESQTLFGLSAAAIPRYSNHWQIGALYGPHGAPDFFTPGDIEMFFATDWKVHYNSDRTGVRLIGPKPVWARKDGGEAGLHPSNIHDNAYAVGTVDFTGDMPVILGPDGPSLGGFVCPATIIHAELWKIGQLRPGDLVRFHPVSEEQALNMDRQLSWCIDIGNDVSNDVSNDQLAELPALPEAPLREEPVLSRSSAGPVSVARRADGDRHLLIEYGENILDLSLRLRVQALQEQLRLSDLPGIIDVTPGVRSLQIHYDAHRLSRQHLLDALAHCEASIPDSDAITVPSRVVHLPLSWDDPSTQLAIQKYMQSVRPDAPWCSSNIEFIRRINGLNSIDDVHRIVFAANYLVLGLGDVYLGAPVATPLDPRHRLVTTKYNPARTWTPENAVGIGGAYMCVYGMEGPGGYQFVGRTLQMWHTFHITKEFAPGSPWLLRFFDQIHFYPVSAAELLEIREDFPYGGYPLRMEERSFGLKDYHEFLQSISSSASAFKQHQHAAFVAERERWAAAGMDRTIETEEAQPPPISASIPEGCSAVRSPVTANVWKVVVETGQTVRAGDSLVILEAMKMEIAVAAPRGGVIEQLHCTPGAMVTGGQHLIVMRYSGHQREVLT